MPKKSYKKKGKSRPSRLKTVKKMVGTTPETYIEKIAKYGGKIGAVAGTVAKIMALINVETKYFETSSSNPVSNTGTYQVTLNNIAGGTAENQRVGEKVVNDNLIINYVAKVNASATNTLMRIIVFFDKKPEVSYPPTWLQVMTSATPVSQNNKDNGDRFIMLRSVMVPLTSQGAQQKVGKIFVPLSKIHSSWNSSSGTDFEQGAIFLYAIADEATNTPTLEFTSRINYYDN